jgi:hypothetical protein
MIEDRRRFGGKYCLHLQGGRLSQTSKEHWLLAWFIPEPEDEANTLLLNVGVERTAWRHI